MGKHFEDKYLEGEAFGGEVFGGGAFGGYVFGEGSISRISIWRGLAAPYTPPRKINIIAFSV